MDFFNWLNDVININEIKQESENLKEENKKLNDKIEELGITKYEETLKLINENEEKISDNISIISKQNEQIEELNHQIETKDKQLKTNINKINRYKEIYNSIDYAIDHYLYSYLNADEYKISKSIENDLNELSPSVILKLNCMNLVDLRKAYRENEKQINKLLELYSSRYTTKANKTIYDLLVIALRAELQNIIIDLKYEKLDNAIEKLKKITSKYLEIVGEGNKSILPTLVKFIGEVEYLFINAIKIEYNYYVKKEQAKQEQLAIREQMRQEAEERKALEQERKKVEKEEEKYKNELQKLNENLEKVEDSNEIEKLKQKILELQSKLSDVAIKKEEIINLQNGKAGTVYIISNLGSFGDDVFKIGMTRRLEPQDRVNELGDASVPFKFDVHSFIFSEDAVSLESKLHEILKEKRLNKVNRRKEFFKINIEELEKIVREIDPTAEFNVTMIADEYRQSLSTDRIYTDDAIVEFDEE